MCQLTSQLSTLLQVISFSSKQSVITNTPAFQQNFVTTASYPIFFALVNLCLLKKFLYYHFSDASVGNKCTCVYSKAVFTLQLYILICNVPLICPLCLLTCPTTLVHLISSLTFIGYTSNMES